MTNSARRGGAYWIGAALAVVTSLLIVWTTIVRDDGGAEGAFMVILAAVVGGFATSFSAGGLARTMLGVAGMQAVLGLLAATAPSTASLEGGVVRATIFHAVFVGLWMTAGVCFARAAGSKRS